MGHIFLYDLSFYEMIYIKDEDLFSFFYLAVQPELELLVHP